MPTEELKEIDPQEETAEDETAEQTPDDIKRERSTIQFPYQDLNEAQAIAKGVHSAGGTSVHIGTLAGEVTQSPTSSMFKLKVSTARIFGLVTNAQGTVSLTPLGARICDPQQEQRAKVEAFLNVPLYKQVYEQFKNASLPPPNGLEASMVGMGVAPKQKKNARQVFQRSATQAGFFAYGNTRLTYPVLTPPNGTGVTDAPKTDTPDEKPKGNSGSGDGGGGGDCDPAIHGLIKRLPTPDSPWPLEKQVRWLEAMAHTFDVVYPRDDDRTLKIEIIP